jgi:hypothetical protein
MSTHPSNYHHAHCNIGSYAAVRSQWCDGIYKVAHRRQLDSLDALQPHFAKYHLSPHFQHGIAVIRRCLQIRNQYAHWALWDDNSGKLAFANLESLAKLKRPVNDLRKLRTFHVNASLLAEQEAYYIYFDRYITWLNYEIRTRAGKMHHNIMPKPKRVKKPRLNSNSSDCAKLNGDTNL